MARLLHIVHTESSLGWGGQEIRVLSEARGLIERGHRVDLLCPAEARIFAEAGLRGVPAQALPIARKRPAGVRALIAFLRAHRMDVLCTHSSTDSWLAALAMLALERPVPIVRLRHISAPVPRNRPTRWLYTRAASQIVTTGEALKRELVERNGFPESRIASVPTGIDAGRFAPGEQGPARRALGLPLRRPLVGIVATLRSWKGHRYLVQAVAGMGEAGLVIVGDGPQRAALEQLVNGLNARERVIFAGDQADVLPWLRALDVFALPSYANEGVPQALVQAMMAGLPCVTTGVGGIGELARHEQTALLVPARDERALASAIARLLADAPLRARLGAAAREHSAARFSLEGMLERMEEIYGRVAARG